MSFSRRLCVVLAASLLAQAMAVPLDPRYRRGVADNGVDSPDSGEEDGPLSLPTSSSQSQADEDTTLPAPSDETIKSIFGTEDGPEHRSGGESDPTTTTTTTTTAAPDDSDYDDDDDDDVVDLGPTGGGGGGGGSNILSLLNLVNAFIPSLSGANEILINVVKDTVRQYIRGRSSVKSIRRHDVRENEIDDIHTDLKPPPVQRQVKDGVESLESDTNSEESDDGGDDVDDDKEPGGADKEPGAQSNGDKDDGDDSDYDEPEGDGQGGGILGILAGLSGGEDGQSDLGTLLAAVSGIVGNLSGDGFDLNALIGSGIGLFVGLLSEGEENPGGVIASYLLTSLDTITGGGATNNGNFIGIFLSKLLKGVSAADDQEGSSDEDENKMPMSDSATFFSAVLTGLLGEMSKTSSHPQKW